jgi:putative SOS response-associated peptidase YedK
MCGRFTLHSRLNLLLQQFALEAGPEWAPRYNIAPTQQTLVVRVSPDSGERELVPLRWGLIPFWATDKSIGNRLINARAETVRNKPAFRAAFKQRRCLVPADGYFEWQATSQGKQPFYVHRGDGRVLAMAGLWESWHTGQPDALETFCVITTDASPWTASVHDRMPVLLDEDEYAAWLDPEFADSTVLEGMLRPYDRDELQLDPISTRINNPRNDDAACLTPR